MSNLSTAYFNNDFRDFLYTLTYMLILIPKLNIDRGSQTLKYVGLFEKYTTQKKKQL